MIALGSSLPQKRTHRDCNHTAGFVFFSTSFRKKHNFEMSVREFQKNASGFVFERVAIVILISLTLFFALANDRSSSFLTWRNSKFSLFFLSLSVSPLTPPPLSVSSRILLTIRDTNFCNKIYVLSNTIWVGILFRYKIRRLKKLTACTWIFNEGNKSLDRNGSLIYVTWRNVF